MTEFEPDKAGFDTNPASETICHEVESSSLKIPLFNTEGFFPSKGYTYSRKLKILWLA